MDGALDALAPRRLGLDKMLAHAAILPFVLRRALVTDGFMGELLRIGLLAQFLALDRFSSSSATAEASDALAAFCCWASSIASAEA